MTSARFGRTTTTSHWPTRHTITSRRSSRTSTLRTQTKNFSCGRLGPVIGRQSTKRSSTLGRSSSGKRRRMRTTTRRNHSTAPLK
uniref:Uncharacterized protein n=1 Tax=Arundo donax TaxID=35708 RepID=A0A0A8ZM02_ARUDO